MNKNAWPSLTKYATSHSPLNPLPFPFPIRPPLDNWWDFLHFLCQICQPLRTLHDRVTSLSDYWDILYWCRGSTQAYLSMNMLCSSDHPTHPLHSSGFISISYQFISGHLHYQRFSCPLIKMSNPILFDKWRKCKLGWTTHELWENCLSSKTHKLLHHANWYRVNLQMYVFKQNLIFIGSPIQVGMNLQN